MATIAELDSREPTAGISKLEQAALANPVLMAEVAAYRASREDVVEDD